MKNLNLFKILMFVTIFGITTTVAATGYHKGPLVIEKQGIFFINGEKINRPTDNEDVTINQMYVQYQVPAGKKRVPVVFTHGCCLTSASWQTTPDGRDGWDTYFVRSGHPVYLTDQTGRGRSGFDATPFNQARAGDIPPGDQPSIFHASHQRGWSAFRFGAAFGEVFDGQRFPMDSVDELYKQMVPDMNGTLPNPNPTYKSLADLAIKLDGAVLVGHSQSGRYPIEAALVSMEGIKGLVVIEGTARDFTQEEIDKLTAVPILVLFGDYIDLGPVRWLDRMNFYIDLVQQINDAGGNATMMHLPAMGIYGNSHMLMQDNNSDQLAGIVDHWIKKNVEGRRHHHRWNKWHHRRW